MRKNIRNCFRDNIKTNYLKLLFKIENNNTDSFERIN